MIKYTKPFLLFLFIIFHFAAYAQLSGKVSYVSDGDTFHLITAAGEKIKVRVADIDCPERTQAFGLEAKAFTMKEINGLTVQLVVKETDRYGRKVAFVKYLNKDLSEQLLKAGLAWHYKKYSTLDAFADLENKARITKAGLWSDPSPIPPWDYRKIH